LFRKKCIEEALEDAPALASIVILGFHPNGEKLVAVGYRYRCALDKFVYFFVFTNAIQPFL
jgi:hypothetical protein